MAGPLANPKWERFCHLYLTETTKGEAYRKAGYPVTGNSAECGATRLYKILQVRERINELGQARSAVVVQAAAEELSISTEWAKRRCLIEAEYMGDGTSHAARVAAVKLAMQALKMLTEQLDITSGGQRWNGREEVIGGIPDNQDPTPDSEDSPA